MKNKLKMIIELVSIGAVIATVCFILWAISMLVFFGIMRLGQLLN